MTIAITITNITMSIIIAITIIVLSFYLVLLHYYFIIIMSIIIVLLQIHHVYYYCFIIIIILIIGFTTFITFHTQPHCGAKTSRRGVDVHPDVASDWHAADSHYTAHPGAEFRQRLGMCLA